MGVTVGSGVGEIVGSGVGLAVGETVGVADGDTVGSEVGVGVGVALDVAVDVGLGLGVGVAESLAEFCGSDDSSKTKSFKLLSVSTLLVLETLSSLAGTTVVAVSLTTDVPKPTVSTIVTPASEYNRTPPFEAILLEAAE